MNTTRKCNLWVRANAVAVAGFLAATLLTGSPAFLAGGELLAFGALAWATRSHWRNGRFLGGSANMVTWLRLLLLTGLLLSFRQLTPWQITGSALLIFTLDGLDGWLARRQQTATVFGAYFDKELDAFFLTALSWMCYDLEMAGWWVLGIGLIRYAYLIPDHFLKPLTQADPRFPYARIIAGVVMTGLPLAFILPAGWQPPVLATLLALLCYSFGRSFVEQLQA